MDSTLISIETIDELSVIAGVRAQIAPLTESAMRGEIDFESSFRQRIALLGNLPVSAMDEVYEEKLRLNPGAERLITTLKNYGVKTALITSGFEYFAEKLRSWLTLDIAVYNRIGIRDGHFTGQIDGMLIDAAGKAKALEDCKKALGLRREQIIAIGDGANDLAMLGMAGTSVAYHAKPVIREKTTYALDYVGLDGLLNLFEKH
ncbi:MAG: phosphoserine phosphatase SerB [Sulfuricella denitrificans]|nr:phosphoserine phosphatase SerB [Sulfuricella denitrificans]